MKIYNSQDELLDRVDELGAWAYLTIPAKIYDPSQNWLTSTQTNMGEAKHKNGDHIIFIDDTKKYEYRKTSNSSK